MADSQLTTPPELCDAIYAAIAAPESWPAVLERCAKLTDTHLMGLLIQHKQSGLVQCLSATGTSSHQTQESLQQLFAAISNVTGFSQRSPRAGDLLFQAAGKLLLSALAGDYMVSWLARARFDSVECFCLDNTGNHLFGVMLLRRADTPQEPDTVTAEDLMPRVTRALLCRDLVTHLSRALRVSLDFADRQASHELGWKLMASSHFGIIGMDSQANVRYLNPRATELMFGNGISIENKRLVVDDIDCNRELDEALRLLLRTPPKLTQTSLSIKRRFHDRALALTVQAGPAGNKLGPNGIAAVIYLSDPGHCPTPDILLMQKLYGLTKGEAGVARAIMAGKSMEECAEVNGHSLATSRNLLKRVYQKTGTARQSELSALLQLSFPPLDVDRLQQLG